MSSSSRRRFWTSPQKKKKEKERTNNNNFSWFLYATSCLNVSKVTTASHLWKEKSRQSVGGRWTVPFSFFFFHKVSLTHFSFLFNKFVVASFFFNCVFGFFLSTPPLASKARRPFQLNGILKTKRKGRERKWNIVIERRSSLPVTSPTHRPTEKSACVKKEIRRRLIGRRPSVLLATLIRAPITTSPGAITPIRSGYTFWMFCDETSNCVKSNWNEYGNGLSNYFVFLLFSPFSPRPLPPPMCSIWIADSSSMGLVAVVSFAI